MLYYLYFNQLNKSCCFLLNTFNLLDDIFIVVILNWRCVLNNRSNIGLVTLKFNFSITFSKISLQKLRFEIGTTTNHFSHDSHDSLSYCSHDSLLLMVIPKYFSGSTFFSFDLSILYFIFFLFVSVSFLHLSVLNPSPSF